MDSEEKIKSAEESWRTDVLTRLESLEYKIRNDRAYIVAVVLMTLAVCYLSKTIFDQILP